MRNECNIIRDLLPLYAEHMVSPDTVSFIEAHMKDCAACRKVFESSNVPQTIPITCEAASLLRLRKKMMAKRIQTIVMTALFVITLLVSAFAVLDAPIYLPYSEDLILVEPIGDCGLLITFNEAVTDFNYHIYLDPQHQEQYYCDMEAWTSLWDQWFSNGHSKLSTTIFPREPYPITVMYLPNNGSEDICVYGETDFAGKISLPKLTLGYYLILAVFALVITALARMLLKKTAARIWTERAMLYPVCYIIAHLCIVGFSFTSYSMARDFALIVFVSLLLYCGFLLAHRIWRLRKEIQQMCR